MTKLFIFLLFCSCATSNKTMRTPQSLEEGISWSGTFDPSQLEFCTVIFERYFDRVNIASSSCMGHSNKVFNEAVQGFFLGDNPKIRLSAGLSAVGAFFLKNAMEPVGCSSSAKGAVKVCSYYRPLGE